MKRIPHRFLSLLLALLLCFPAFAGAADRESNIGYQVTGVYNAQQNALDVTIYAHGASMAGGRLALDFATDQLQLAGDGTFFGTFTAAPKIRLMNEALPDDQLVSNSKGYAMVCWAGMSGMTDASAQDVPLASLSLTLRDGVTVDELHSNSLRLRYTGDDGKSWDSAAWVRLSTGDYKNAVSGFPECAVRFDYPGCDAEPAHGKQTLLTLTDTTGKLGLSGTVNLLGRNYDVPQSGVTLTLPEGKLQYRAAVDNYEEKVGVLSAVGGAANITLRTKAQLVQAAADAAQIGFRGGDTADNVTQDMYFASIGEQNVVLDWESDTPSAVNRYGNITRAKTATKVGITVTARKDGLSAQKKFQVTIAAASQPVNSGGDSTGENGGETGERPTVDGFRDLGNYPWAQQAINELAAAGIIKGTSATTFAPAAQISRGDFLTLLMRMLKPDGTPGEGFADVPQDSYYYSEITLAKSLGIAQGSGDNRFQPRANITRQDMMTLTYRTLLKLGRMAEQDPGAALERFADHTSISSYAELSMGALVQAGYIQGGADNRLTPRNNATRAEAAVFLYRIYCDQ